ncbi:MAG: hypothetical protein EBS06_02640 [Proteobacteria bacterium]|nr:hypothetical protein [Pseudomonadota bacterium]
MKEAKVCSKCILTSQVPNISFDQTGVCNFCTDYEEEKKYLDRDYVALEQKMLSTFEKIFQLSIVLTHKKYLLL